MTPGEEAIDGGYDLPVDLSTPSGTSLLDVPFILHSGMSTTLISDVLAQSLGLDVSSLPVRKVEGAFGPMTVHQAKLQLRLFDDPGFPTFYVSVGVTDAASNPFGDHVLGADVRGQLPYTEMCYHPDGTASFSAAASIRTVPEPSASLLAAAGVVLLLLRRHRRA